MNQVGEWNKADPGYTYLVLDLDIENRGYDSFSTNPLNFSVVVNNVKYNVFMFSASIKINASSKHIVKYSGFASSASGRVIIYLTRVPRFFQTHC